VLHRIWLVIKLSRDILPTNFITKFDDYTMKNIQLSRQMLWTPPVVGVPIIRPVFSNGRIKSIAKNENIMEKGIAKKCIV